MASLTSWWSSLIACVKVLLCVVIVLDRTPVLDTTRVELNTPSLRDIVMGLVKERELNNMSFEGCGLMAFLVLLDHHTSETP